MTVPNNANTYLPGTIVIPSSMVITGITNSVQMVVTAVLNPVTQANTYLTGMLINLFVPRSYGMFQADGLVGQIVQISGLNFTLDIDSSQFDPFVVPVSSYQIQPASFSPAGSRNLAFSNATTLLPFQSLNDRGN